MSDYDKKKPIIAGLINAQFGVVVGQGVLREVYDVTDLITPSSVFQHIETPAEPFVIEMKPEDFEFTMMATFDASSKKKRKKLDRLLGKRKMPQLPTRKVMYKLVRRITRRNQRLERRLATGWYE